MAYLGSSVKGKMICFWIEVEPALSKIPGFEPELKKREISYLSSVRAASFSVFMWLSSPWLNKVDAYWGILALDRGIRKQLRANIPLYGSSKGGS